MKMRPSMRKFGDSLPRFNVWITTLIVVFLAGLAGAKNATAQATFPAPYIPIGVPTATSTLYTSASSISPGRVAVDKAGNVFFIGHTSGSTSTLYEIPASSPVVTVTTPTALITGLGQYNANGVFVDAAGTLWVADGNGSFTSSSTVYVPLIEIPASNGIPNTSSLSTPVALSTLSACSATSQSAPCYWSAGSVATNLTSYYLQASDVYSDGKGNVYLMDYDDGVSSGKYNRLIKFNPTSTPGTGTLVADSLTTSNTAQVTVAGDGNPYYYSGGVVSLVNSNGTLTTVGNLTATNLTLLTANVNVGTATGVTTDPWGNLIISGAEQISEIPLEGSTLANVDQFNLLVGSSAFATYGGSFDVHGNYYSSSATSIFQIQVGGYNYGNVNVGSEVTTAAPVINIAGNWPGNVGSSTGWISSSPANLSSTYASYLQSFPYSGNKTVYGSSNLGAPSGDTTVQTIQLYFQPIHAGLLRGAYSTPGFIKSLSGTNESTEIGIDTVNVQGVGVGPQPLFLPGTATQAVTLSQLDTSSSSTTIANGFTPEAVAIDSFGDIYVADSANGKLDIDCLSTTNATAIASLNYCQTSGIAGKTFELGTAGSSAVFASPVGVVLDGANSVYVLDSAASSTTATVTKYIFYGLTPIVIMPGSTTVAGTALSNPSGIAIDGYGNLYISDTGNGRIIQAHQYGAQYSQNIVYVPSTTTFSGTKLSSPMGLAVDASGNIFIADTGNSRIVEYSVAGVPSVVSTTGVTLSNPTDVKVLPSGALVVTDTAKGLILVDGGEGDVLSTNAVGTDGVVSAITLKSPSGVALDPSGNIYVADPSGSQVVKLNVNSPATATAFSTTLLLDTGTETSWIYNSGNSSTTNLIIASTPTTADNSSTTYDPNATNEFAVDASNTCAASSSLTSGAYCNLVMDFTPVSTANVLTPTTGTATVADNLQTISTSTTSTGSIATFTAGSTQTVMLTGQATKPLVAQTITFTNPSTSPDVITYSSSIPTITLAATSTPASGSGSGNPITFSISSDSGTGATLNGSVLSLSGVGSVVIEASQAGLDEGSYAYAAGTAYVTITVQPIGTVPTPTLSVVTGTYTANQAVTISDTLAGVSIYYTVSYTVSGKTPTTSSTLYTAGSSIPVDITTTIEAIAVKTGYTSSAVASATYTMNPDFTLSSYTTDFNIPNGLAGSTTVAITPLFGFDAAVSLTCTGTSEGDTCNLSPTSVTPTWAGTVGTAAYSTMTIQAYEVASAQHSGSRPYMPVAALGAVLCFFGFRKRNRLLMVVLLLTLSAVGAGMMTGCSSSTKTHTSTFTLTATSGTTVHTQTITLTVNNL